MYIADERKRKENYMLRDRLIMNLQLFAADTGADGFDDSGADDSTDAEFADGDEEETEEEEVSEEDTDDSEEETEVVTPKQSKEQNKAFADMRKRTEQAERAANQLQQELQAREQWVKQTFSQYGVTNWQDYQAKMEQQVQKQREQQFIDAGIDPRMVKDLIKNDPELQAIKQQNQMLQNQMQQKEAEAKMVNDYGELTKEYPELVTKPEDIPKEVWNLFDKGYSLLDAYEKVNRKEVREYWSKGAKQKVMNDIKGKSHIKADKANGDEVDSTQIPKDVLDMYKSMMPKKSMKEYIAHYKKNNK